MRRYDYGWIRAQSCHAPDILERVASGRKRVESCDTQVIGVPDERMGEAVCAWIRLREGVTDVTPEMIKEACKGKVLYGAVAELF